MLPSEKNSPLSDEAPPKLSPARWSARTKLALALLVLLPVGVCGSLFSAFLAVCTYDVRHSQYGNINLDGHSGKYTSISSSQADECQLFVEIPGEGNYSIHEIPQEVLDRGFERSSSSGFDYDTVYSGHGDSHGNYWSLMLKYRDGVLVRFHGEPSSFSRDRDGPYLSLPMPYREFHDAWGRPDESNWSLQLDQPSYH